MPPKFFPVFPSFQARPLPLRGNVLRHARQPNLPCPTPYVIGTHTLSWLVVAHPNLFSLLVPTQHFDRAISVHSIRVAGHVCATRRSRWCRRHLLVSPCFSRSSTELCQQVWLSLVQLKKLADQFAKARRNGCCSDLWFGCPFV